MPRMQRRSSTSQSRCTTVRALAGTLDMRKMGGKRHVPLAKVRVKSRENMMTKTAEAIEWNLIKASDWRSDFDAAA